MPIVDSWMLIENQSNPRKIIADGGAGEINIYESFLYEQIKEYV